MTSVLYTKVKLQHSDRTVGSEITDPEATHKENYTLRGARFNLSSRRVQHGGFDENRCITASLCSKGRLKASGDDEGVLRAPCDGIN